MKALLVLFLMSFLVFSCSPKEDNVVEPRSTQQVIIPSWADVDLSYLMGSWKVKHSLRTGIVDKFSSIINFEFDKNGTVLLTSTKPTLKTYIYYWQYIKTYDSRTQKYSEPRMIIGDSFYINNSPSAPSMMGLKSVEREYVLTFLSQYTLVGIDGYDVRFALSK